MQRNNLVLTVALFTVLSSSSALGSDARRGIVGYWIAQQDRITAVRFTYHGNVITPEAYVSASPAVEEYAFPLEEWSHTISGEALFDFERRRIRMKIEGEDAGEAGGKMFRAPLLQHAVFDNDLFTVYEPHENSLGHATIAALHTGAVFHISRRPTIDYINLEHFPPLLAAGAIPVDYSIHPSSLHSSLQAGQFRDAGSVVHNGIECAVLTTSPDTRNGHFYEYWVAVDDPRKIYRMMGYGRNETDGDKPWFDIQITYRDSDHGPLPDRWTISRYNMDLTKAKIYDVQLGEFEFNPRVADADFDLQPPPGTRVCDERLPEGAQEFVQGEVGEPNLPPVEYDMQQARSSSRYRMAFGILAAVAIVIGVLVYRKRSAA